MVIGGVCSMYFQNYIRVISLVQKGRDYLEESQRNPDRGSRPKDILGRGSIPKENASRGASPRGAWPFAIDVKGGELITLM